MTKHDKFNAAVEKFILSIGGRKIREKPGTRYVEKCGPEFSIPTVAGELKVTPGGDWIACRFEDIDAAKRLMPAWPRSRSARLNGFSGKWNFTSARGGKLNGEDSFAAFKFELEPLLAERAAGNAPENKAQS